MDPTHMFDLIPFEAVRSAPKSSARIHRNLLRSRILFARTNRGNYIKCHVNSGDHLSITKLVVYNSGGCVIRVAHNLRIRSSFSCDLDEARETSAGAEFWWHGVARGVHYLEPRNGAQFYRMDAFEDVAFNDLRTATYLRRRLDRNAFEGTEEQLVYCRTGSGNYAKVLLEWGNTLILRRLEVFNRSGRRILRRSNISLSPSRTIDLDTGVLGGDDADLWWHAVDASTFFLEPLHGAAVACPSYFRHEKYLRLLNRTALQNRMVFESADGAQNYLDWPESQVVMLKEFLDLRDQNLPFPIAGPPSVDMLGYMTHCDALKIYLAHVAQSLWADASRAVPWRLSSANATTLSHLFDSRLLLEFSAARGHRFNFFVMGAVTHWDPVQSYNFLVDEAILAGSQWQTIRNLAAWCREHLVHITGFEYDHNGGPFGSQMEQWEYIFGYSGLPLVDKMLFPLPGRRHVTHGCWGTSGFLAALLRTVNVPVRHGRSNFSGRHHSRPEFFTVAKSLAHGDDPYNGWVRLGHNNVPIGDIFWDHADLVAQVDSPAPLPGKTVPETASWNHRRHLAALGVAHKTNWLLRMRCQDLAGGDEGMDSRLWQALHEYYNDAQINTIADDCDTAIAAIPGQCASI